MKIHGLSTFYRNTEFILFDLRSLCGIYARIKLNRTFLDPFMTSDVFKCFHLCTETCGNQELYKRLTYFRSEFPVIQNFSSWKLSYRVSKMSPFASSFQTIKMFCNICKYVYNLHRKSALQAQDKTLRWRFLKTIMNLEFPRCMELLTEWITVISEAWSYIIIKLFSLLLKFEFIPLYHIHLRIHTYIKFMNGNS